MLTSKRSMLTIRGRLSHLLSISSMNLVERQLQHCLNKIERWANENGFRFSKIKAVCMHFFQQRILHPEPDLKLYRNPIPVVEETKFLGLSL